MTNRTAFVVTSVIDPSNDPLSYNSTRSVFTVDERLRQTVYTIACIDTIAPPNSNIFLIDASPTNTPYFNYQKNLIHLNVKDKYPDIYQTVRTHPNKSHGECLMLVSFFGQTDLTDYTHFIKLSGRYFTDGSFHLRDLTDAGPNAVAFKCPISWDWKDHWNYEAVDRRIEQGDNLLHQYCSVLFGWGQDQHNVMTQVFREIADITRDPANAHYDSETLLYHLTRPLAADIIETDWMIYGWGGPTGVFLRA